MTYAAGVVTLPVTGNTSCSPSTEIFSFGAGWARSRSASVPSASWPLIVAPAGSVRGRLSPPRLSERGGGAPASSIAEMVASSGPGFEIVNGSVGAAVPLRTSPKSNWPGATLTCVFATSHMSETVPVSIA